VVGAVETPPILKLEAPDVTRDLDLTVAEVAGLLELAGDLRGRPSRYSKALEGRSIALLFEKPSLRTRLTFELAIKQLGGHAVFIEGKVGGREPIKDVARNLDRWVNGIVARVFRQNTIEELAHWSADPVVNALSDLYHPCQALADVFTLQQHFGNLKGLNLAYVGDGNNVAHSLMLTAVRLGVNVSVATPPAYAPAASVVAEAAALASSSGSRLRVGTNPVEAVSGANAVYTDVWASMGKESEAADRKMAFHAYQVNEQLLRQALPDAVFMHCLPAKRGEEVTDAVMESPNSAVFDQAENRLHTEKALLLMLLG